MKQANNNSVDILLRSLARREHNESWPDEKAAFNDDHPANALASDHLDADELNLYAEGVLPAPARTRYTEHLAECGKCRSLVVGLAQAAGTAARYETPKQQSGLGFWQSITALFSLPVLRYAIPAVVLTGVVAIGLLALRDQRSPDLVARNQQVESPAAPAEVAKSDATANAANSASPSASLQQKDGTVADADLSELKNNPVDNRGLLAKSPATIAEGQSTVVTAAKDSPESPRVAGAVSGQPVFAPEPAPPPKAAPLDEVDAKLSTRNEQASEREVLKRQQDEYKLMSKDDSPRHGPARSRSTTVGSRRDADLADEAGASGGKDKKEAAEETETRTVSGRRFRRLGNAWVDTAYAASRGVTNVGRGSEQFRALLADEPGLRSIVQQLGGEVVVVWKNTAYRFR